jgi:hypothetical protein
MQVVVSPLAPHRPGDQMQPVVQRFAFYCQGAPAREAPVDAEQAGRSTTTRLPEPQHLKKMDRLKRQCLTAVNDYATDPTGVLGATPRSVRFQNFPEEVNCLFFSQRKRKRLHTMTNL